MKGTAYRIGKGVESFLNRLGLGLRAKLIIIFLLVKVIPLILLTVLAWQQINILGVLVRGIAIDDASTALNNSAIENIERMTTDAARRVADFLYARDKDILFLAKVDPSEDAYSRFIQGQMGRVISTGEWVLADDGKSWVAAQPNERPTGGGESANAENNDMDGFNYRQPEAFEYSLLPLYDEITFVDLNGNEIIKVVAEGSSKVNYPMNTQRQNVSDKANTYVKAETYFDKLGGLEAGEIYVSDVIGAYVGSNYIGMYTPDTVAAAAKTRGYDIDYNPEAQSFAGLENPNGQRFEGIVRWATPVERNGSVIGYVTFALNHDHIMEFVDHLTPMNERYTELTSAFEGNYAFIWDYKCRSICHPRHNSIVGFDPETGDPQIPWLESSIYDGWQASGLQKWTDYVKNVPSFNEQSRKKTPAPALTKAGLVGLDGRYLNNAPQCTGWMDLTQNGGSGSFYILWSGLYKLTTAGAIPYYTGQYAPSEENGYSLRGFGFVAIGAGLEDFTRPARETEERLNDAVLGSQRSTFMKLFGSSAVLIVLVVLIAIWVASYLTGNITTLIKGISRFRAGERQFRFNSNVKDEFGTIADSFDEMADSIVGSVNGPLTITDMNHKIIYMNEESLAICGKTLEQVSGAPYEENSVYPPNSPFAPITSFEAGRDAEIYFEPITQRYIMGVANYLYSKQGEPIGYIIITNDLTDMMLEQMKIEEQRTLLDTIFTASPDMIWYMDAQGKYQAVNPRFAAIAGRPAEDFIGKTAREMLPMKIVGEFVTNDKQALTASDPIYNEERIRFADDHEEILDAVRTPITDANGASAGMLGFARNVSARVRIESELRDTQIELEQAVNDANRANEHKGEFLARMSHEIRTPMNAVIGLANIVERKLSDMHSETSDLTEVQGHVRQIEASSQHLLGLLNDILDLSKIEAGKIELMDEVMELPKLITTVSGIIKPRCDDKNITFMLNYDSFTPSAFMGDSLRLRQVLINLLGNAVKFTPELGRIEFSILRLDRQDGKSQIEFAVRDSGIGISEEKLESIFKPFEQGGGKISKQFGGTGLGLPISSRIVELFGGEITVTSQLGAGSEFKFSIWLTETESDLQDDASIDNATDKFAGKRALLVDDVEINRVIVMSMLDITGIEIDEAADGLIAVDMFKNAPGNGYDIVFMDVQMPNMDGYEATEAIRAMDRPGARNVPIIALTANAFKEDIDKAIARGMNAHITKPVAMERLVEIMFRFLTPS